ncbi:hypothetical protein SAMN05216559_2090 [Halomicrobium zhouii]|uniref:Uncharacterized protein n=1 Tax=Halomicrobium zhouii TaxID=767519 RepID=A0A1I6L5I4_9EURY|nr:hypothetical protein [Halomicrobium zhouii]SFR98741.1 hypothetical protein SAMN05216559_2090 [Halomicrobium zhouii]
MDRQRLESEFADRYDADEETRRVVARQVQDLADSERITEDFGFDLTVDDVLANLADAPDDHSLAQRWNWWMNALDLSHGGYERFHVRQDLVE